MRKAVWSMGAKMQTAKDVRTILGIDFYVGDVPGVVKRASKGGLVVAPAAPALKELQRNTSYREALLESDIVITDSSFMVLLWNLIQHDSIPRISGLRYLRELLLAQEVHVPGNVLWVMAGEPSTERNVRWLRTQGIEVPESHIYNAPIYGAEIEDTDLLERVELLHPRHIVITIGGGNQERLGLYLKHHLDYLPSIHCIGAAIAFLSGDQVKVPAWVDRLCLAWLFRCVSGPRRYIPRYWSALRLAPLMWRYRDRLPVGS